jgi:hypothetical protein
MIGRLERPDFDLKLLYEALDQQRCSLGMTWSAMTWEINRGHTEGRPVATSTIKRLKDKPVGEGDGILGMLLWLRRSPESFVPGFEDADADQFRLPEPGLEQSLRWDTKALHPALNAKRQAQGMTWNEVAEEIGGCTTGTLMHLAKGGRVGFPGVMRLVMWLSQPAATFTICATDAFIFGPQGVRTR